MAFGAWVAFGLASLILTGGDQILVGVIPLGVGVAVMTIGDNFVQPMVIDSAVELPFLMIMISVQFSITQS